MNTTTHPPGTAVSVSGVSKSFPSRHGEPVRALNDVSFDVRPGEIIGLLGPNGAGKTTLIDLILGLTTPTGGSVSVFGDAPQDAVRKSRVGAVMQTGGLLPNLTVKETTAMIATTFDSPRPVDEVLAEANLTDLASRRVSKCSGGEQQRLRFALALLGRPDLLILDEPTTGMDAFARHSFWDSMKVQAERGASIIFSTHYLEEAQDFAERIVMLRSGDVIADESTAAFRDATRSRTVTADLVSPGTFDADRPIPGAETAPGSVRVSGERLTVAAADSDEVISHLLGEGIARNVLVTANTLEDTFISLTRGPQKEQKDQKEQNR